MAGEIRAFPINFNNYTYGEPAVRVVVRSAHRAPSSRLKLLVHAWYHVCLLCVCGAAAAVCRRSLQSLATWDADKIYGCVCDSSWTVGLDTGETQAPTWFGADCSLSEFTTRRDVLPNPGSCGYALCRVLHRALP